VPKTTDASDFWEQSDYATKEYVEAPLTDIELARVEKALGYKLPAVYAALCREQYGGIPTRTNHRTQERTSWAEIRGQHRGHSLMWLIRRLQAKCVGIGAVSAVAIKRRLSLSVSAAR
jgi:hypothetical protein